MSFSYRSLFVDMGWICMPGGACLALFCTDCFGWCIWIEPIDWSPSCLTESGLFLFRICVEGSYPVWDDFISKATKLQTQLRTTVVAVAAFLDAFQKVADLATNSRGKMEIKHAFLLF
ncbi:hypothetical protein ILYODFUR_023264 [Ilyodon furcidens]|uniref:IMD domain-containing protein n=1 Tax=Ilyodon furcidens TaxID=33524 RepID=A0ABV0VJD7_9TELE